MPRKVDYNELIEMGSKAGLNVENTLLLATVIGIVDTKEFGSISKVAFLIVKEFVSWDGANECYKPTKEGLKVFRKIKRDTGSLAQKLRLMYPPGMKDDRWPWRGTPRTIQDKLDDFVKDYPDVTEEEILKATTDYLSKFNTEAGRSLLAYFIGKTVDGDKRSILAEYIYANREGKESKPKSNFDQL